MTRSEHENETSIQDPEGDTVVDGGGDPACWAHRVCQACGRLNEAERPTTCEACGAEFLTDD